MSTRRDFLKGSVTCAAATCFAAGQSPTATAVLKNDNVFKLGVASGYPTPSSVVLWTRLAVSPLQPAGGMGSSPVPVRWQVATDEGMRRVVQEGVEYAMPEWAHSIHVEPQGLAPGREYWYRFTALGMRSVVGRTRTAPAYGSPLARLKLAVASCQHYEQGYFNAYDHIVRDDVDLLLQVGDYIYEGSWGPNNVRNHGSGETRTLEEYRARYALYRSDPKLAAAHAAAPWMVTWDDHEVSDDYAGGVPRSGQSREAFRARRAAAYRAYYEHMPLPMVSHPSGNLLRLYAQRAFGDLASIYMLDQRQFRSPECAGLARLANDRTMLGERQECWLSDSLKKTGTRWNLLAQGTMMSHVPPQQESVLHYGEDAWTGYPAARARLTQSLADLNVPNPVMISGDIHAFVVGGVNRTPEDFSSPLVAPEFVSTSISSDAATGAMDVLKASNPNLQLADNSCRGYLRLDITEQQVKCDLVALDTVKKRHSRARTLASYVVESGDPQAHRV